MENLIHSIEPSCAKQSSLSYTVCCVGKFISLINSSKSVHPKQSFAFVVWESPIYSSQSCCAKRSFLICFVEKSDTANQFVLNSPPFYTALESPIDSFILVNSFEQSSLICFVEKQDSF